MPGWHLPPITGFLDPNLVINLSGSGEGGHWSLHYFRLYFYWGVSLWTSFLCYVSGVERVDVEVGFFLLERGVGGHHGEPWLRERLNPCKKPPVVFFFILFEMWFCKIPLLPSQEMQWRLEASGSPWSFYASRVPSQNLSSMSFEVVLMKCLQFYFHLSFSSKSISPHLHLIKCLAVY